MSLIPARFLLRVVHPCLHVANMPLDDDEHLIELPPAAKLDHEPDMDESPHFAELRIGWNAAGIGLTLDVRGKEAPPVGDPDKPRASDGLSLWLDTRDARTFHRAGRYCHQFHFLPAAGGADRDEPMAMQTKIHRALADAPIAAPNDLPIRCIRRKTGYRLEIFLSANVLNGFDPENNPRMGIFYAVRDLELGEQTLGISADFPFSDDPSLWSVLELTKPA
ncbi:DOMON domain-containing protein [Tuwongella immobilis]|uniref:Carbohydrate-binding domain-containing protein n=1 Tax=Tuwongella immobilis TaxID=692036 RepID=A0A6C2YWR3_9BACT|nr:hypothetical protein [Tuwongella immobilis]VIP05797.1 Uncharacterized protein OS=Singulisphaera acidiphila (strain ATCC BAA-1392 / DSM 18658 / VKM B-2454 / MOB10) GN=Sinac_5357 PE=4 SV=1 [Tuwongella immobilis]VTS08950.1 Uncharacterized protein OS=Singulisphaera acidiphila (strain ATCC BAA-1392 / DSM 18658 / VKM B-2454 / MOB10) GN=Sinac_5357 PE=4 SV=1 [Tuwongella immobilis]